MSAGPTGLVYRDGVTERLQAELADDLVSALVQLDASSEGARPAFMQGAYLSAAAFECALRDAGDPAADVVGLITDQLAGAFLHGHDVPWMDFVAQTACLRSSRRLRISAPEGFAYYALSPRSFARAAATVLRDPAVLVIGVRTIGVALAAAAKAQIARTGRQAERIDVRPIGHPYDRRLTFTATDRDAIARVGGRDAGFLIVDEGPGLSGSTFLAVAEALVELGIPAQQIHLLGSRVVDPKRLVCRDAVARWRRFSFHVAQRESHEEAAGELDLSGGHWRRQLQSSGDPAPRAWPEAERLKVWSADRRQLRKFAGIGSYGRAVYQRGVALASGGWIPEPLAPPNVNGFVPYRFVPGRRLTEIDLTSTLIDHIGRYLAARVELCPARVPADTELRLSEMTAANLEYEGHSATVSVPGIRIERPVVCDGQLAPHEWVRDRAGRIWKVDALDHGDDHFLPGPCDIAWDLAGAMIEWAMNPAQRARLIAAYQNVAGDDPRPRLPGYLIAYAAFRARHSLMAAQGCEPEDALRWRVHHGHHASALAQALRDASPLRRPARLGCAVRASDTSAPKIVSLSVSPTVSPATSSTSEVSVEARGRGLLAVQSE
jgi:hypothetical protein